MAFYLELLVFYIMISMFNTFKCNRLLTFYHNFWRLVSVGFDDIASEIIIRINVFLLINNVFIVIESITMTNWQQKLLISNGHLFTFII